MEQEGKKKKFRWRYFIEKGFQGKFILSFVGIILLDLFIILLLLWVLYNKAYDMLPGGTPVLQKVDLEQVEIGGEIYYKIKDLKTYNAFDLYSVVIIVVSFLHLFVIAIFGLFFSHKMAGPIYRLKRELREYIEGKKEFRPIRLRKGDFFHDLADLINQALLKKEEGGGK